VDSELMAPIVLPCRRKGLYASSRPWSAKFFERPGLTALAAGTALLDFPHPMSEKPPTFRERLHEIIFEADTAAGKSFDIALLVMIILSVIAVLLESVASVCAQFGPWLRAFEWAVTIAFTIEYLLRLYCVGRPARYARSFFGIVDLLAVLPTYLSLIIPGAQTLLVIRALRLLRVFRVLKLAHFVGEATQLRDALRASARKIIVFLGAVFTTVVIVGAMVYLIEGEANGFTNIPVSIYWAIVTMTTVGYGDIAPQTPLGKMLASVIMILGYGIIAVPTGIVSVELAGVVGRKITTQACPECGAEGHDTDAVFCKFCGAQL
jgi:voltage-gated potassium channel